MTHDDHSLPSRQTSEAKAEAILDRASERIASALVGYLIAAECLATYTPPEPPQDALQAVSGG